MASKKYQYYQGVISGQSPNKQSISNTQPKNHHQGESPTIIQRYKVDSHSLTAENALQLQSTIGNRAVGQLIQKNGQQHSNASQRTSGLPAQLKTGIESLSGLSMADVKVHYNAPEPAQLHANAYTQDKQIYIAPGQEQHLAHEAWHVVQQKQGRVKPTVQMKGKVNLNDETALEKEADIMGNQAVTMSGAKHNMGAMKPGRVHSMGCGCASCCGQNSGNQLSQKTGVTPVNITKGIIQRCPRCADPACKKGEKCGYGDDLGGLFASGTSADPVKYYNQKQGHGGLARQWEHPLAKAAMKKAGLGPHYKSSPVVGMPTSVHRGGISGMGGGVSSTGYSKTAQGWADHVAAEVASGGNVEGIRLGLIDDINSYASQGKLREDHKSTFVMLIRGYVEKGLITHAEGDTMGASILAHIDFALKYMQK